MYWSTTRSFPAQSLARMKVATQELLLTIWQEYVLTLYEPVTWSFNIPDPPLHPEIVRARLGRIYYRQCFTQRGDQYYHDLQSFEIDRAPDTDQAVVASGNVSATHIDISEIGQWLQY